MGEGTLLPGSALSSRNTAFCRAHRTPKRASKDSDCPHSTTKRQHFKRPLEPHTTALAASPAPTPAATLARPLTSIFDLDPAVCRTGGITTIPIGSCKRAARV